MSLSPLKPASDEVNVKAFFSLEASLGPVDAARAPLIPAAPAEKVDATGFDAVLNVVGADVDAAVTDGIEPAVVVAEVAATPPTGGRVMVKERGVGESVVEEGSVLMADTAVIVVAPPAADVAVTLGAC